MRPGTFRRASLLVGLTLFLGLVFLGLGVGSGRARSEEGSPSAACSPPDAEGGGAVSGGGEGADGALLAGTPSLGRRAAQARSAAQEGPVDGLEAQLGALLEEASKDPDPRSRARLLIHVARSQRILAERASGQRASLLSSAVRALEAAQAAAQEAADDRLRSYALGYRGELYEQEGRLDAAERLSRKALFAAQRANSLDALYRWHWQLARIHRDRGRTREALVSFREAVAALDKIRAKGAASNAQSASFRLEVTPIYQGLIELLLSSAAATDSDAELQSLLVEARDAEERYKVAELRDYYGDACLDTRQAPVESIPGTVVVYPIVLPDRVELVVARGGRLDRYVSKVDEREFTEQVRSLRTLLTRPTRQYLAPSVRLYDWLIRPLEPVLAVAEVETLVIVPGGPLRTIPFAALYDREAGQFLIEKYPLAITPGVTLTEPHPIDPSTAHALVAGLTEPVQGYPALPAVSGEVEAVASVFPGEQLLDAQFEVDRLQSRLESQPFSIVHIASHGEFHADDAQSFLVTYDGRLSMDRLAELVSTTRFRRELPLELLTLSACETAVDDDRAALGLAGVALRSGARSALATLWAVHDEASSELVTEFYVQLGRNQSRARALQQAQLRLLHEPRFRHPAFWSAFLLISSWL